VYGGSELAPLLFFVRRSVSSRSHENTLHPFLFSPLSVLVFSRPIGGSGLGDLVSVWASVFAVLVWVVLALGGKWYFSLVRGLRHFSRVERFGVLGWHVCLFS